MTLSNDSASVVDPLEIARANRFGRVIYEGEPREADYVAAAKEAHDIRSELANLRARLRDLARVETHFSSDAIANDAAGALSTVIVSLHRLGDGGDWSFQRRAMRSAELWADIHENPDQYVLREGKAPR